MYEKKNIRMFMLEIPYYYYYVLLISAILAIMANFFNVFGHIKKMWKSYTKYRQIEKLSQTIDKKTWDIVIRHFIPKFLEGSVPQRKFQNKFTDVILLTEKLHYKDILSIADEFEVKEEYVRKLLDEINLFNVFKIENNIYSLSEEGRLVFEYVRGLLDVASNSEKSELFFKD